MRGAAQRERARVGVGRVHAPQVHARRPERDRAGARAASPAALIMRRARAARRRASTPRACAAEPRFTATAAMLLGVLVQEQLARRDVGERRRVAGLVAAAGGGQLEPDAEAQAGRGQLLVGGVEDHVAEAVAGRARARAARRAPPARAGARRRPGPRSRSGLPTPASGAPPASAAATGAKMSRPWKVADTGSRRCGERPTSTASTTPPRRSAASDSSPLSGPTRIRSLGRGAQRDRAAGVGAARRRPSDRRRRGARRAGGTGRRCAASGRRRARRDARTPWVTSITRARGQSRAMTAWQTPTNSSSSP